jgi:hypothetical protein
MDRDGAFVLIARTCYSGAVPSAVLPERHPVTVAAPSWPRSRILSWLTAAVGILVFALALRYLLIEPHEIGIACAEDNAPGWCAGRQAIVMMHIWKVWGSLGLIGGLLAISFGWRWAIWLGLSMSLMGLVLYNSDFAAVGLMLTLLRLPRA